MSQCVFLCAGFIESSPSVAKIKVFEKYFTSKIHLYDKVGCLTVCLSVNDMHFSSVQLYVCAQDEIERQGSVLVDYADLTGDKYVLKALPDLTKELKEQPEVILNCLGMAVHQVHTHSRYYTRLPPQVTAKL